MPETLIKARRSSSAFSQLFEMSVIDRTPRSRNIPDAAP
jgi:hypothetical protein